MSKISVSLPQEALKDNITFVDLDRYPTNIRSVTEDEAREFFNLYRVYVSWCHDWTIKLKGYGIAFPQIGIPINAAVLRFDLDKSVRPTIMFNLRFKPEKSKKSTQSIEGCYSVGFGAVPFAHKRWRKIKAQWEDTSFQTHSKVMRIPNPANQICQGHVFQHETEHMRPDFKEHVERLVNLPANRKAKKKILTLVDEIKGGIKQIEPIFDPLGKYHVSD